MSQVRKAWLAEGRRPGLLAAPFPAFSRAGSPFQTEPLPGGPAAPWDSSGPSFLPPSPRLLGTHHLCRPDCPRLWEIVPLGRFRRPGLGDSILGALVPRRGGRSESRPEAVRGAGSPALLAPPGRPCRPNALLPWAGTGTPPRASRLDVRRPVAPFSISLPHSPPGGLLPFHVTRSPGGRVHALVLPDTHFSRATASQGGPGIPPPPALRGTVRTHARVWAARPEGRFFLSRNKRLSLLGRSSSYLHNPPKPPWRVGIRGVAGEGSGKPLGRARSEAGLVPQAGEAGHRPASSSIWFWGCVSC